MKSLFYFLLFLISTLNGVQAQVELIGTGSESIFSTNNFKVSMKDEYFFDYINASRPSSIVYFNNKIYGSTEDGGKFNFGALYEYDLGSKEFKVLYSFNKNLLSSPKGPIYFYNNKIYGTAEHLDRFRHFRIFAYDLTNDSLEIINKGILEDLDIEAHFFTYKKDTAISIAYNGGNNNQGFIYKLDLKSNTAIKVADFSDFSEGKSPFGKILTDGKGIFYGFCQDNSTSFSDGILYSYNTHTKQFSIEHEFIEPWGRTPTGKDPTDIYLHSDSIILGLTRSGGYYEDGVLFEYNLKSKNYTVKVDFGYYKDFSSPGRFMKASNGNFYGMISSGYSGSENYGAIYEYNPNNDEFSHTYKFEKNGDGQGAPYGNFIEFDSTQLIGFTSHGGNSQGGTLFNYHLNTESLITELNFNSSPEGVAPRWIMEINDSLLYGITSRGGSENRGVLFKFNSKTKEYSKLLDFKIDSVLGYGPATKFVVNSSGIVYGCTQYGGKYQEGVLFSINPQTDSIIKIFDFGKEKNRISITSKMKLLEGGSLLFALRRDLGFVGENYFIEFDPKSKENIEYPVLPYNGIAYTPYGNIIKIDDNKAICLAFSSSYIGGKVLLEYDFKNSQYKIIRRFDTPQIEGPHNLIRMPKTNFIYVFTSDIYTNNGKIFKYNFVNDQFTLVKKLDYNLDGSLLSSDIILGSNMSFYGFLNNGYETPYRLFEYNPITNEIKAFNSISNSEGFYGGGSVTELQGLYNKYLLQTQNQPFLYPNPFKKNCSVLLESEVKDALIIVYDIKGNKIKEYEFQNTDKLDFTLNTKNGIYIVKIYTENKLIDAIKVIKSD